MDLNKPNDFEEVLAPDIGDMKNYFPWQTRLQMTLPHFCFKLVIIYSRPYELMQLTTCDQYLHYFVNLSNLAQKQTGCQVAMNSNYTIFSKPQYNKCYLFFFEISISSEFGESLSWRCARWVESFSINALFLNNSASSIISCTTEVWTSSEPFRLPTRSKIASSPARQRESLSVSQLVFVVCLSHLTVFPFDNNTTQILLLLPQLTGCKENKFSGLPFGQPLSMRTILKNYSH